MQENKKDGLKQSEKDGLVFIDLTPEQIQTKKKVDHAAMMRAAKAAKREGQIQEKRDTGKNKKIDRTRNWTFLVYPESAPENWRELINAEHIAWVESPLHEGEQNPDNESEKKAHWHVMLAFESHKTFDQVLEITKQINSPIPKKVNSMVGLVRYMVHMDNPEKKQYNVSDIKAYGGISVADMLKPTSTKRYAIIREMITYVKENQITQMIDLIEYAMNEHEDDWFPLLCDNCAYIMNIAVKSIWHKSQQDLQENEYYELKYGEMDCEQENDGKL